MSEPNTSDCRKWEEKYKIESKRHEILSKLENGGERYQVDALTHSVVEALARGADPISIIDELLTRNNDLFNRLKDATMRSAPPSLLLTKEEASEFLKTIKK